MPHKYDTAFKLTLQHVDVAMRELLGSTVTSWKNIEFPQVVSLRADLLGETKAGELVHFELQSGNAKDMAIRMLEYGLAVLRGGEEYHRYPIQVLLYVRLGRYEDWCTTKTSVVRTTVLTTIGGVFGERYKLRKKRKNLKTRGL